MYQKKITAAFDGLKFSESTRQYAFDISCKSDCLLVGIFLEDFTYHSYKLSDMVGSEGISAEKMLKLKNKDTETRQAAVENFKSACQKANVKYSIHHDRSIALQELLKETIYSDLLVIGANETLSRFPEEIPSAFLKDLLSNVQCPVLVVPDTFKEIERIILLYDGDPSSVYAAKMFSYMFPYMKSLSTEIITVKANKDQKSIPESNLIHEFINCHYPQAKYKLLEGSPEVEIVKYLSEKDKTLVVLGSYRRNMVSRLFRPSMADVLIRKCGLPLFVAHYK